MNDILINPLKQECQQICNTLNITHVDFNNDTWKNEFKNSVNWNYISKYHTLSELFIRKFKNNVDWYTMSTNHKLSESCITEFKDYVNWNCISKYQKLSEPFIREFQDYVNWDCISKYQKLSESFIREFQNYVMWSTISRYQKLSEPFIREFQNKVFWDYISYSQKLSESFIREFQNKVNWDCISNYQKLSEPFIKEFNLNIDTDNWNWWTIEQKLPIISNYYEILEDDNGKYIIAYKGIGHDRYSKFSFHYQYNIGQECESPCDCTHEEKSFGLTAWNYQYAKKNCHELLIKVKIYVNDIGRIVNNGGKIRCSKLLVIS
jgi:hypothetical protein